MTTGLPGRLADCQDCFEPIRFVLMEDTRRALPVNPRPNHEGNVAARVSGGRLVGFVISNDHRPGPFDPMRFVAHFATCEARKAKSKPTTPPAADEPLF